VVCPELAAGEDLALVARRLQAAVARPLPLAATTVVPQLSLGWALAEDGDEPADVLRRADAAMYVAKGAGRSAALPSA
jgi:GGDEF domain-containing protein